MVVALLTSACGLFGGGAEQDRTDRFADPAAQELAQAVSAGSPDRIRALVQGGVSVDAAGTDGLTMLQWAILERRVRSVQTLLELGADVEKHGLDGSTALHTAAVVGSPEDVRLLLETGVDPDLRHAETDMTPLMHAVGMRTTEHFHLLLDAGADPTLTDRAGGTALHGAAMVNAGAHVLALLERGADPRAVDGLGATFQDYYWQVPVGVVNETSLAHRKQVADWLTDHGVPLHENASWTKD